MQYFSNYVPMHNFNKATPKLFYECLEDSKEYARKFAIAGQKVQKSYAFIGPEWQNRLGFENWILTQRVKEWLYQFVCLDCE